MNKILTLPVPPSVNHIYVNTRGGGKRLNAKGESYVRTARALSNAYLEDYGFDFAEKGEWLYIDLNFYMPDKRIRDSHNCLKILLDVLEGIFYENDYWVLPRIQYIGYDKLNPRIDVHMHKPSDKELDKSKKYVEEKSPTA